MLNGHGIRKVLNKITWHWSPTNNFDINLDVSGWNESLIVYLLAASSPTFPINIEVYNEGWLGKWFYC